MQQDFPLAHVVDPQTTPSVLVSASPVLHILLDASAASGMFVSSPPSATLPASTPASPPSLFRDAQVVHQIEEKVTNRLRQVTSAIRQDGVNQVSLIRGAAERQAAIEFAKAATLRPQILGATLREMLQSPRVANATFEVLETQQLLQTQMDVTLVPPDARALSTLLAARGAKE